MNQHPDDESGSSIKSLRALAAAEGECTRCPLYRNATQAVPGEGPKAADFMLVGEQPGDKEDLAGKPFVGPAGRILDSALKDAGIAREDTFVTNAVKHFKHERRGKRRLHKRPNNYEIERCKIWLERERDLVKPSTIIALGVTAARSLTGKTDHR
jgi:uracil-DNA glycosylase